MNWFKRFVRKLFPTDEDMHIAPTAPAPLMPRCVHGWQPVRPSPFPVTKMDMCPSRRCRDERNPTRCDGFCHGVWPDGSPMSAREIDQRILDEQQGLPVPLDKRGYTGGGGGGGW